MTSGVLNVEDGCGGEAVYTVGQAFLEAPNRVHRGKNLTGEPVVTAQTLRSAICESRRHRRFAVDAPHPAFPGSTCGVDGSAPAPGRNRSFSHQWKGEKRG